MAYLRVVNGILTGRKRHSYESKAARFVQVALQKVGVQGNRRAFFGVVYMTMKIQVGLWLTSTLFYIDKQNVYAGQSKADSLFDIRHVYGPLLNGSRHGSRQ